MIVYILELVDRVTPDGLTTWFIEAVCESEELALEKLAHYQTRPWYQDGRVKPHQVLHTFP